LTISKNAPQEAVVEMSEKVRARGPARQEWLDSPPSYQVIGDVAVICIPAAADDRRREIAAGIISQHRKIKAVLNKTSKLSGETRTACYELLAGCETVALHREFGFAYRFDLREVFFNPRLAHERTRVASMIRPGECVLVPFAGVGPFAIPAAARGARVLALEKSTAACRWLAENARLNGVENNLEIVKADALSIDNLLAGEFDRAILPTPYGLDSALEVVSRRVKSGGALHFYTFKKRQQIEGLVTSFAEMGLKTAFYRRCGNIAPRVHRWAFDLKKV
jgi:tRNA (guanine37-N1)-methyltransferase